MVAVILMVLGAAVLGSLLLLSLVDFIRRPKYLARDEAVSAIHDASDLNLDPEPGGIELDDTENLIAALGDYPSPDVKALGWCMEVSLKTISGEEKARLPKGFFTGSARALDDVARGIEVRSRVDAYNGTATFVATAVSRGMSPERHPEQEEATKKAFMSALEQCREELLRHRPLLAIRRMLVWQDWWKNPTSQPPFPRAFLPLAVAASDAVIDIYGEQLVFERSFETERHSKVAEQLQTTIRLLAGPELAPREAVEALAAWRSAVPERPRSGRKWWSVTRQTEDGGAYEGDGRPETLGLRLVKSGFDRIQRNWSPYRILMQDFGAIDDAVEELAKRIETRKPDAIFGLRASGGPIAALVAHRLGKPFFWFVDASDQSLFPRHKHVAGLRGVLVDSHSISAGNMTRHVEILLRLGVELDSAWVLLDCGESRAPRVLSRLENRVGSIRALWTLDALRASLQRIRNEDELAREVLESLNEKGDSFWRLVPPSPSPLPDDPRQLDRDGQASLDVCILDEQVAQEAAKVTLVDRPYRLPSRAADLLAMYEHSGLVDGMLDAFLERSEVPIDAVIALSHWGVPLAVILASYLRRRHSRVVSVYTFADRLFRRPEQLPMLPSAAVLVNDVLNTGATAREFLANRANELKNANVDPKALLVFLDNDEIPAGERGDAGRVLEQGVRIYALTRSSFLLGR